MTAETKTPGRNSTRILVAVDGSASSRRTVAYVAELAAGSSNFHVGLLHLEILPTMLEWGGSEDVKVEDRVSEQRAEDYQDLEDQAIESGQALLQSLQQTLTARGIDVAALLVKFEDYRGAKSVAAEIVKTAKERGYGTVVVGRHTYKGLKRLFGHHVGEELVRTGNGLAIWVVE